MNPETVTSILVGLASLIGATTPVGPKDDKRAIVTWAFALVRSMIGGPPVITSPTVAVDPPVPDDTPPSTQVVTEGGSTVPWRKHVDERTNALLWLRKEAVADGDAKLASDTLALISRFCDSKKTRRPSTKS